MNFSSLKLALSSIILFSFSLSAATSSNKDSMDYDAYKAGYSFYEDPASNNEPSLTPHSLLSWVPSYHVRGLNVLGLVPSFNVGVGRVNLATAKEQSALFEYNWGYRVFSWFNLAFSYQNQKVEMSENPLKSWKIGKLRFKENSKLALHSLMFKFYLESPKVLKVDRFFLTPYVAMGIGPGWIQRGILGTSVSAWEGDVGIRFGAIHPLSFLSLMTGGKYIQWGTAGHSVVQYLGLRLNF